MQGSPGPKGDQGEPGENCQSSEHNEFEQSTIKMLSTRSISSTTTSSTTTSSTTTTSTTTTSTTTSSTTTSSRTLQPPLEHQTIFSSSTSSTSSTTTTTTSTSSTTTTTTSTTSSTVSSTTSSKAAISGFRGVLPDLNNVSTRLTSSTAEPKTASIALGSGIIITSTTTVRTGAETRPLLEDSSTENPSENILPMESSTILSTTDKSSAENPGPYSSTSTTSTESSSVEASESSGSPFSLRPPNLPKDEPKNIPLYRPVSSYWRCQIRNGFHFYIAYKSEIISAQIVQLYRRVSKKK